MRTADTASFYGSRMWIPDWQASDDLKPQLVYFRTLVTSGEIPADTVMRITADSRYKLYINDRFIQEGPCKANRGNWYYEEIRPAGYLEEGRNCIAVEVLRYPEDYAKRNHSILRTGLPFLMVSFLLDGVPMPLLAEGERWTCIRNQRIQFRGEQTVPAPLYITEASQGNPRLAGWRRVDFCDETWQKAAVYSFDRMKLSDTPRELTKSPIPCQRHEKRGFQRVVTVRDWETPATGLSDPDRIQAQITELVESERTLVIPARSSLTVELDAGELMTGYPVLAFTGGGGSEVHILYSECYVYPDKNGGRIKKGDRSDYLHGELLGLEDSYLVSGYGTEAVPERYEPFWFRTFRYVRLEIITEEELQISSFHYQETGYPLEAATWVETSDPSLKPVWEISLRTLKRCMHETYMDCPFYEQLQYVMDSRLEILYTYMVSGDDRLARKCMEDFRCSAHGDGMINSCAPALRSHVIPGFSVYYIMMIHDHLMYFGDLSLVRKHLPAVDGVLGFFDRHLTDRGLVGKIGGKNQEQNYWSFVDWTKEWQETTGVPTATRKGPITMESLLYLLGLECGAELSEAVGRTDTGREYRMRAEAVRQAVRRECRGAAGLLQDGPGVEEYSVHCQVFGVLAGVLPPEEGRHLLLKTVGRQGYAQCSVSMSYYLFRALEKTGLYEMTAGLWEVWRQMTVRHMTTCVENDTDERSDCHAWGAVILYELPAVVLGVRPVEPGFGRVSIAPVTGAFDWARGEVMTPKGLIRVEWEKDSLGNLSLCWQVPDGVYVEEGSIDETSV